MKKVMRRRDIITRQKEGIYPYPDNEHERDNREKSSTKNRSYYSASEEPEYLSIEKPWRPENERANDRSNSKSGRNFRMLRYRIREALDNYAAIQHDDLEFGNGYSRRNYEFENYYNRYGEHPASRGEEEYRGINKRHPGLLGNNSRDQYKDHYDEIERNRRREENERMYGREEEKQIRNHKNRLAIRDYLNRGQYERPFHPMPIYDPAKVEYERRRISENDRNDNIFHDEGFQYTGNTEGFGRRGYRQQGHDWMEEDEYREGHAPRYRGFGKYGSR